MAFTTRSGKKRKLLTEINITPFVDVMLVLLIIFMVTAPMMISGVNVDLPETNASQITADDEPLTITVDKDGKIYLQDTEIELAAIVPKLEAVTKEKKDTKIFIRGDSKANYGQVAIVMANISEAGFTKISLITQSKQ